MKAVVFHEIGDIRLDTVSEPRIEEDTDVIVKLTASAICGTIGHLPKSVRTALGKQAAKVAKQKRSK